MGTFTQIPKLLFHSGDSSNALKGLAYQIKHRQRKSQNGKNFIEID